MRNHKRKDICLYLLALYLLIFWYSIGCKFTSDTDIKTLLSTISFSTSFLGIAYIFVFIGESLITSDFKSKILFWGKRNVHGNQVFSKLREKKWHDIRIDENTIVKLLNRKYPNAKDNSDWYKIYLHVEHMPKILASQDNFLFSRDLAIITIEVTLSYLLLVWPFKIISFNALPLLILIVLIALSTISTHVHSKRFVMNVIIADLTLEETNESNQNLPS